jgi:hypothetical protein
MKYRSGVDTGLPDPFFCMPAPAKDCVPGRDCCYSSCGGALGGVSVSIDLEARTLACAAE